MTIRYPIDYEVTPKTVNQGESWFTIRVKNISNEELTGLDIRLNSFDTHNLDVIGESNFIPILTSQEEREVYTKVSANQSGSVYLSINGWRDGSRFFWESPLIPITVGQDVAELVNLFAMTEPYPPAGEAIRCEAKVQGRVPTTGLTLEFWADFDGFFEEIGSVETKELDFGEIARYSAEFTPEEEGLYTIYAYLYDEEGRRIGREMDMVYVEEA